MRLALALLAGALATPAAAQELPVTLPGHATWTMTVERTRERILANAPELAPLTITVADDSEHGSVRLVIRARQNGSAQEMVVDAPFCASPEFSELQRLATDLRPRHLDSIRRVVPFEALPGVVDDVIAGRNRGRAVIAVRGAD